MRVVHYLNQFFGGIGGEEHADTEFQVHDEPVGPGRLLEQILGEDAQIVRTIVCGDNYATENMDALTAFVVEKTKEVQADLFVAGPCFEAGRYGVAAAGLCVAVSSELDIPVVTGMATENPGVDLHRQSLFIVDSGQNSAAMRDVLTKMSEMAHKLAEGCQIGSPEEEGYIARGILKDAFVEDTAAERLVADTDYLVQANCGDMEQAVASGMSPPLLDRLRLDGTKIEGMAVGLRQIADLCDPVGTVSYTHLTLPTKA